MIAYIIRIDKNIRKIIFQLEMAPNNILMMIFGTDSAGIGARIIWYIHIGNVE